MNFNLSRLRYLYEIIHSGSMRAASEKMNVAPSSVSRQIATLEEELGTEVLERGRGKARLTQAGELLIKYYREDLTRKETLASHLNDIRGLRRGEVTIAIGEGYISDLLTDAIHAFLRKYQEINLDVKVAGTNEVLTMVEEDDAHIGMVFDCPPSPKINIQKVYSQPLKAVVSADHPLAGSEFLTLSELSELRLALPQKSFRIREIIDRAAFQEKTTLMPTITSNSLMVLKSMATTSDGVTILPDIAVVRELRSGQLISIPLQSKSLSRTSADIVTRLGRLLPVASQEFLFNLQFFFNKQLV